MVLKIMFKQKHLLYFLLFSNFIILTIIVWSMNKGFDLSDEGYYITGYNNLIESPYGLSAFYFLTNKTLSNLGSGLIFFRAARLLLTIIGSLFLSVTFFNWVKKFNYIKKEQEKRTLVSISLFCLLGSLVSYSIGPQTLSYNHYTLFFGNLFLGLLFLAFSFSHNVKTSIIISAVCGIICGLEFFVKIPTSILLSFLFLCVQVLLFKHLRSFSFINLLVFVFSAMLAFTVISFPSSPLLVLNEYYYVISSASKFTSHNVFDILIDYKNGLYELWNSHLYNFVPLFLSLIIASFISHQNKYIVIKAVGKYLYLFILLFMIYKLFVMGYFSAGSKHYGTISLIYILFIFIFTGLFIFQYAASKIKLLSSFFIEKIALISILLFFPIICSLGSTNNLQIQILFFLNSWFLVIYLIYAFTKFEKSKLNFSISVLMITITLKSTIDIFSGLVIAPYRVNGELWKQTEALKIQSINETIFVDKELKNSIAILQNLVEMKKTDALFVSSDLIGLSYIFNVQLFGIGGYSCTVSPKEFICQSYNESILKKKKKNYFILNSEVNSCNIFECISDNKIQAKLMTLPWNNLTCDSLFVYERHN